MSAPAAKAASGESKTARRDTDSQIRVLHFAPRVCWPLDTGAKLRNYHLAREIAQRGRITLLAFSEAGENGVDSTAINQNQPATSSAIAVSATAAPLLKSPEDFYERVIGVPRDRGYTLAKIVRGAVGRTPLPVLNYTTQAMKGELTRLLDEEDFDIIQIESIHLAEYLPIIRRARSRPLVICDWHNIESELMWRYSEREPSPLRRIYARRASRQMSALERRSLFEFDAHIVVSERDGEKLLKHAPAANISIIENGVETASYSDERIREAYAGSSLAASGEGSGVSTAAHDRELRRIAFVGSMDYHANVDAAVAFAREVWPLLHEEQPRLIFTIVGRDPAPEVQKLAALPGVEVTGTVSDVRPYYYETLAAVIPLRVGGGSRLKILEAMAAGVPVVSTALGAEGIDVEDGENIILAETSSDFREAISRLSEDKELRNHLIERGRALVSKQYDWSRLGAALYEKYQSLLEERESPRP